jgi:ABC-type oligopeptide transport system substrate-binding subunit
MMTDENAATANGSFTANFKKVTAPDARTLVIELKKPQATMTALDVPIVPRRVWEKVGDFSKFNNDKQFPIVGNGPFVITDFKVDQYVKLKPKKDFSRGAPKFDELVFATGGQFPRRSAPAGHTELAPDPARAPRGRGGKLVGLLTPRPLAVSRA